MTLKTRKGMQTLRRIMQLKKTQGEDMEKGTVIKYKDNRGNETLMVTLGKEMYESLLAKVTA